MSSNRTAATKHRADAKSPALYAWIVGVAVVLDGLMFWQTDPIPGAALDATKEETRLNQGTTPGNAVEIQQTQHADLEDKH